MNNTEYTLEDFKEIARKAKEMEKHFLSTGMARKEINKLKGVTVGVKKEWPAELDKIKIRLTPIFTEMLTWIESVFSSTVTDKKEKGQQYVKVDLGLKYNLFLWNPNAKPEKKIEKKEDRIADENNTPT